MTHGDHGQYFPSVPTGLDFPSGDQAANPSPLHDYPGRGSWEGSFEGKGLQFSTNAWEHILNFWA